MKATNLIETIFRNTIKSIEADLANGKRKVKDIAAECKIFEVQTEDELHQSIFARLSDCKSRKDFAMVINSL